MSGSPSITLCDEHAANIIVSGGPVSIYLLRAVLTIAEDPMRIFVFGDPKLASACIRLIQGRSKEHSILDDEFSALCLKIIVISVQVATLVACKTVCAFLEEAQAQPDPSFTLAKFAVSSLCNLIQASMDDGRDPPINLPITVTEAVTLMECLYRERDLFLSKRCASPESWAGWSFILYPAWIYLICEHTSDQKTMALMLGDLACRFAAGKFEYSDEVFIIQFMAESAYNEFRETTGTTRGYHLGPTDLQDSELGVTAVASRFFDSSLAPKLAYYLFLWAGNCSDSSRPDLMLVFLEASLSRLWRILDSSREDFPLTHNRLREVAQFPALILGYIMSAATVDFAMPNVVSPVRHLLVNAAFEDDIFGLLARTLMFPLPCNYVDLGQGDRRSGLEDAFKNHFQTIEEFSDILTSFYPLNAETLQDSHTDWLRAAQHFEEHCHMYDKSQFTRTYVSRCRAVWKKLGFACLGKEIIDASVACAYPRCPYPTSLGGVLFTCGGCREVAYCSHRCRYLHWDFALSDGPHADVCSPSALALVKR